MSVDPLAYFGLKENGPGMNHGITAYVDSKGVHHEGIEGYLEGLLGFCGCGNPELVLDLIAGALEWIHDPGSKDWPSYDAREAWFTSRGGPPVFYLIGYLLDDKGFTEHGGSVNGAWLTDKGVALKALMALWRTKEFSKESA